MTVYKTLLLSIFIVVYFVDDGLGFCVLDNKNGWWLDCGIRDSYLFRIADFGGVKANFDVGFGLGDNGGFPYSIKNTNKKQGHSHNRREDQIGDGELQQEQKNQVAIKRRLRKPAKNLVPPPGTQIYKRQDDNTIGGPPLHIFGPRGQKIPIIIKQVTEAPPVQQTPQFSGSPTVSPTIAEMLQVPDYTPADTDHVPSFAAKEIIVREAPDAYFPPDYPHGTLLPHFSPSVKLPRTKFFCEEQKFHPGLYADTQLGCKVFHLCIPASVGSKMTSYLCPNSTLFDQSILQCNWWFNVKCEDSPSHYDANLALADGYRKINAAHLPLTSAQNLDNLALLSPNHQKRSLDFVNLAKQESELSELT